MKQMSNGPEPRSPGGSDDFDTFQDELGWFVWISSRILDASFFLEGNLMSNKLDFSKEHIGRRALITGGTRGIGAAIAQRLLDAGAKVVVTARSRGEALPAGARLGPWTRATGA